MRFTTTITSFLLASIVLASPVPSTSALESRQLCQIGIPCFVQAEVNNAFTFMNNAVAIAQGPIDAVVAGVSAGANALVQVSVDLKQDVAGLVGDAKTQLQAQIVAAIVALIRDIRADLKLVTDRVPSVSAELTAAVSAATNAIAAIEAVVGPCV